MDFDILYFFQNNMRSGVCDTLFTIITTTGEHGLIWMAAGFIMVIFKRTRLVGITLMLALLSGVIVGNMFLKNVIGRTRPYDVDTSISLIIGKPNGYSMPSGHTLSAVIGAVVIFLWDRRYGIPALIYAVLMGVSRVYLFVHYPSDVIYAMLLGVLLAMIMWNAKKLLEFRFPTVFGSKLSKSYIFRLSQPLSVY